MSSKVDRWTAGPQEKDFFQGAYLLKVDHWTTKTFIFGKIYLSLLLYLLYVTVQSRGKAHRIGVSSKVDHWTAGPQEKDFFQGACL